MVQPIAQRYIGSPIKRSEDTRILTGHGTYVDDIALPGMLHAAFVRSPMAHARITSVETAAAREAPGVVAVVTGEELEATIVPGPTGIAAMMGGGGPKFTTLCTDKVRLVGDPIVMVIADSRYEAEDACELVEVDFDELPVVASAEVAIDPASPPIFEDLGSNVLVETEPVVYGDVDGPFARADRVVTAHLRQHRHQNVPMEGRGVVASFDPATQELTIHAATQGVHMVRSTVAKILDLRPEQVRVLAGDIGGSFGLKFGASREEVAVAALSKQLGRPVKWTEDRSENLTISGQAREESFDVEAAITNEGDILALKVRMLLDSGAYPGMGGMVGTIMQSVMPGPYKLEGLSFASTVAITNKASYVAYRGPWAAETFVRERMINLIAAELGMDPFEVRMRNVVTRGEPPERMINGRSLAGVTARESLESIAKMVDIDEFRRRQQAARTEGRYLGLGMATYIEAAPGPRGGGNALGAEQIRAKLETDGSVSVFTGQMPHGQGHQTTFAQIVADQMGVPFEQVRIVVGDTSLVPPGFTGGSRAATMAGGASLHVARDLRTGARRGRRVAGGEPGRPRHRRGPGIGSRRAGQRHQPGRGGHRRRRRAAPRAGEQQHGGGHHLRRWRGRLVEEGPTAPRSRSTPAPAWSESCATWSPKTAASSSTPPSSRARYEEGSLRASGRCSWSGPSTTTTGSSFRPASWTTSSRPPRRCRPSRSSIFRPSPSTPTSTSAA